MSAALINSLCVFLAVATTLAAAIPEMKIVGEGLLSNPVISNAPGSGKGMRYAGPIVYSNEKPPIIYFPPPPKDAKPGFISGNGGLSFFGKNKSPKSIKYVPMPHHDLPVLIYTSDKMPPIHVVSPPQTNENGGAPQGQSPSSFGSSFSSQEAFGSLSSTYRGIIPEATSARVVTSSYEIPGTSYGSPMKAPQPFSGSLDASSSGIRKAKQQFSTVQVGSTSQQSISLEPSRPYNAQQGKKPPHIMFSGHPPVHIFNYNQPDMFVKAPKEIPLRSYHELPPKASFGPPKSSFGPPSSAFNTFIPRRPQPNPSSFPPVSENLVFGSSQNRPTVLPPPQSSKFSSQLSSMSVSGGGGAPRGQPTYSFTPNQKEFSFGPLSVEYGPPSEPFVSFEPTGSLSSLYGAINDGASGDEWIPGPPPKELMGDQIKENVFRSPSTPPTQAYNKPSGYVPTSNTVYFPPSGRYHHHTPFSATKLGNLLSSFRLKRPMKKLQYHIAPKNMHKPPIIIYYGKKAPIHVYQKEVEADYEQNRSPTTEQQFTPDAAASSPSVSLSIPESLSSFSNAEVIKSEASKTTSPAEVDLTYGASQNSEIRVAAPSSTSSLLSSVSSIMSEGKPAIIQAKPVDIFSSQSSSSSDLQPSIYMARNSLNTIYVSDLSGSGTKALKTFIVRRSEDSQNSNSRRFNIAEATIAPFQQEGNSGSYIISHIAQNRISGDSILSVPSIQSAVEVAPVSISAATTQVDLDQLAAAQQEELQEEVGVVEEEKESNGEPAVAASNTKTTILIAPVSHSQTDELSPVSGDEVDMEKPAESLQVQVAIIQSPSSFQTSLSQAEKEAEKEGQVDSSS